MQLGVGPRSVRLIGLTDGEVRWLAALDPRRGLTDALTAAALEDIEPARATDVLERLVASGLVAPAVGGRLPSVAVVGSGALPALLSDVLRQSEQLAVTRVRAGGEGGGHDLAVVVSPAPADPASVQPWLTAGTSVLPLWCQPEHASIGPVVTPRGRPCLHCLDLTRAATDPDWPHLRAQLTRPRVTGPEPTDGLPALRLLAAGLTSALVLDHVAERVTTPEWSFEVATPGPTLERHRWPAHPSCPECGRAVAGPTAAGEADAAAEATATPRDERGCSPRSGWGDTMAG